VLRIRENDNKQRAKGVFPHGCLWCHHPPVFLHLGENTSTILQILKAVPPDRFSVPVNHSCDERSPKPAIETSFPKSLILPRILLAPWCQSALPNRWPHIISRTRCYSLDGWAGMAWMNPLRRLGSSTSRKLARTRVIATDIISNLITKELSVLVTRRDYHRDIAPR
jgi:hypothetical protein